ncbi:MAG: enoyl-CoA hydratase/carnithine racemase [Granulosicoccus sp.]|jgi:enoyl-CoA hydratase/carnithine racemase
MLVITDDGNVRTIILNRPEAMNAFNGQQFDELTEALLAAGSDSSIRVVILTGAGRAFTTGLDLSEVGKDIEPPKHGVPGLFSTLVDFPKPLMLAINGFGVGFGTTIIGMADMAFMSESARLRCPFSSLGVVGEAASTYLLPRLMGPQAAAWMLYSSAWFNAEEAKASGLVLDFFPHDTVQEEVMKRAQAIAANSPVALMRAKELAMGPLREMIRATMDAEIWKPLTLFLKNVSLIFQKNPIFQNLVSA